MGSVHSLLALLRALDLVSRHFPVDKVLGPGSDDSFHDGEEAPNARALTITDLLEEESEDRTSQEKDDRTDNVAH